MYVHVYTSLDFFHFGHQDMVHSTWQQHTSIFQPDTSTYWYIQCCTNTTVFIQVVEIPEALLQQKVKHQRQGLFLNAYANMKNKYEVENRICRICNNEYGYAEYGIEYVK
jgi:hypothetical protein